MEVTAFVICFASVIRVSSVKINRVQCGSIPEEADQEVVEGDVPIHQYPWLGMLYYFENGDSSDTASATPVVLIHQEFVLASAADVGPMPKHNFRANTRVLLGDGWAHPRRRVRNYVIHPHYQETLNTVALVQLKDAVTIADVIKPICITPDTLSSRDFYVVRFKDDVTHLQKEVLSVMHVPPRMCKDFYIAAKLYEKKMRPPHVVCAVSMSSSAVCAWDAGAALVDKDGWGRWTLLGFGVRGPGCGAPSRYLDMLSYFPWVEDSLLQFQAVTLSRINDHKYVLRRGGGGLSQRHGDCDAEEIKSLIYRESIQLTTDNNKIKSLKFNFMLRQSIDLTCSILRVVNGRAHTQFSVQHICVREPHSDERATTECYTHKDSRHMVYVEVVFYHNCIFELLLFGYPKNGTLINRLDWHWEEATHYEDFVIGRSEYRGSADETLMGFEPLDDDTWVPEFDLWTTTTSDPLGGSSTTPAPTRENINPKEPIRRKSLQAPNWY